MSNKVKYFFIFVGLFLLNILYSPVILELLKYKSIDVMKLNDPIRSIILILIELSLMIMIYLLYRKELKKEFLLYKENFNEYFTFGLKMWVIGIVLMITTNLIINLIYHSSPLNEESVKNLLREMPIYSAFAACIVAPFTEEIIFRKSLKKIFDNNLTYIIIAGLVFGLVHNLSGLGTLQMLYIIPYGLFGSIFAYTYVKTNSIFVSMTFHLIHNTFLVLMSFIMMGVI